MSEKEITKREEELRVQIRELSNLKSTLVASESDGIGLRELLLVGWFNKWTIIGIVFMFSVASLAYALFLPDQYKSTAILASQGHSSSSALSQLASSLGGIASITGVKLGDDESKTNIAVEVIKTWGFLDKFIRENQLEVEMFAAIGWKRNTNQLIINGDLYDVKNQKWVREPKPSKNRKSEPSSWELFEKIKDRVAVEKDSATGLITLSVEYYSPVLAKEWADILIKMLNKHFQAKDKQKAINNIQYLESQIETTQLTEMKNIFFKLIEEQRKTLMLTEVDDEYVFRIVSEPRVAEEKSKPKRLLILVLGLVIAFVVSLFYILLRIRDDLEKVKDT